MTPKRTRTLTRQAVITAALQIVDRDGADALTMRALGRELGVDPMAAYNHVPNKSAVLDGVVDAVWSELVLPNTDDLGWQAQLEAIGRVMRQTLLQHPNALEILATQPNRSDSGFRLVEATLIPLLRAGVPPLDALAFINAAVSFIIGSALAESGSARTSTDGGQHGTDDPHASLLDAISADDHPDLAKAMADADLDQLTGDLIFDTGLKALIAGIEPQERR